MALLRPLAWCSVLGALCSVLCVVQQAENTVSHKLPRVSRRHEIVEEISETSEASVLELVYEMLIKEATTTLTVLPNGE